MFKISPITNPRKKSVRNKTAYKNMHNKAFPPKLSLNAYIKMHKEAFPSPQGLTRSAYTRMHKLAFPNSPRRTRRSRS
jgi:predicted DNA-binding transcriptional regulator AlpA